MTVLRSLRDLPHIFNNCPVWSGGGPEFFSFLANRFPEYSPEQVDLNDLVFDPDPKLKEVGRFSKSGNMFI